MDEQKESGRRSIDESWKERVRQEKETAEVKDDEEKEASFGLFVSGLMIEALIALGDVENPATKTKNFSRQQAKFMIDTLGMLKEKTKNNLARNEEDLLDAALYDLRMRFLEKEKSVAKG
jgi:hypothetical protein